MFQQGQGNKEIQAWCSSEHLGGTSCLTRAVRGSMSIGRKYQLFIIQLLICAFTYFPEQTLSMLPPQTLNTHVIHQTLIFLLSLHRCAASAFGSHSLDLPQTAPGTRLMSIFFFPSALLFIDHSFFYMHVLFSLNFLPSFPLFRSTSGKSFF